MFIESMSSNELLYEYCADLSEIHDRTLRFDKSDYVERYLWKRHKQPQVTITKIFTTARNNRYLGILIYAKTGTGKGSRWDMTTFHVGLMNTGKGVCAVVFYEESRKALKFTPHFFKRYRERFSKVADWQTRNSLACAKSVDEIIPIYITRNLSMTWIETKSVFRDKIHIFGPVNDGVALLQWDKNKRLLQANTFLTTDMLDAKQSEMVKYAKIYFTLSKAQRKKFRFPDFISDDESSVD